MVYNWYIIHVSNMYIYIYFFFLLIHNYSTRGASLPVISRVATPFARAISPLTHL